MCLGGPRLGPLTDHLSTPQYTDNNCRREQRAFTNPRKGKQSALTSLRGPTVATKSTAITYIYVLYLISILLFLLPSDNVQHDIQHSSLITFPKEENLGSKRKPTHQVYLPSSVPTFGTSTPLAVLYLTFVLCCRNIFVPVPYVQVLFAL